jgi:HTH-type transcriptional regulator/antitoxin MqsA
MLCPVCEEGELSSSTYDADFEWDNVNVHLQGLECSVCSVCGSDPVLPAQLRRNQRRIADARRSVSGLLTGDEVRRVRESLGLTQQEAASVFGGGSNAFSKYERGDVTQSVAMDNILRGVREFPRFFEFLCERAGIEPKQRARAADTVSISYHGDATIRSAISADSGLKDVHQTELLQDRAANDFTYEDAA